MVLFGFLLDISNDFLMNWNNIRNGNSTDGNLWALAFSDIVLSVQVSMVQDNVSGYTSSCHIYWYSTTAVTATARNGGTGVGSVPILVLAVGI